MIELIQILLDINILPKFGADWSIFTDDRVQTKSNITVFLNKGQITLTILPPIRLIIELFQDFTVTYILTKFGADWLFFVHAKV